MLNNPTDISLHEDAENNIASLLPPETRMFPVNEDHPTTMDDNEIQLAQAFGAGKIANIFGRSMRPVGPNVYGNIYEKLLAAEAKRDADKLRARVGKPPEEEARDALRPLAPGEVDAPVRPTVLGEQAEELQGQRRWMEGAGLREPPPTEGVARQVDVDEGVPTTPGLVDETNANAGYQRFLTFGDEDLDALMKGILEDPKIRDGVIARIRVKGTMPGMEDKVPDEGHIHSIISAMGDAIQKKLAGKSDDELARIGLEQTADLAELVGRNPDKLARQFAAGVFELGAANPGRFAATMVAGKNLLVAEVRKLDELTDRVGQTGADVDRVAWKRQAVLVANVVQNYRGVQTDMARAMGALRTPTGGDATVLTRDFGKILDDFGGSRSIDAQIDAYRNLDDVPSRLDLVRQLGWVAKTADMVHDMWINSMLSAPFTHIKNTAGVAAAMVWDIAETAVTAGRLRVGIGMPSEQVGRDADVTFGDLGAKIFGQMMSLREAVVAGGRGFWFREDALAREGAEMTLVAGQGNRLRADGWSAEAWEAKGNWGVAVDWSGHLVTLGRAPVRALMAEDSFMKIVSYRGSLFEQAYRAGRQAGLKGDDFSDFVAEFLLDPPRAAREVAAEEARYVTLQTDMVGGLKKLQAVLGNRGTRFIVPFYKTPTNALLYVGERSPFAKWITPRYKDAIAQGGPAAANARTRWAMGASIMAILAWQWEAGDFTGGLGADYELRKAYERQGIKPYHFRLPWDGETYYNYGMLEPISTIIGMVADVMEVVNHPDISEMEAQEVAAATIGVMGYNLTNKSFMQGVQVTMEASRDPARFGPKFFANYARSMVPGSAALNEIRKELDDIKRFHQTLKENYMARLPGLSQDLPPAYDLWGREQSVGSRFSSPYKPNAVDAELVRLGLGLSRHPKQITVGGVTLELESEQIAWFHQRAGKYAFERLNMLITKPGKFDIKYETKDFGALFKKLRKASIAGSAEATDTVEHTIKTILLGARKDAKTELLTESPFAKELVSLAKEKERADLDDAKRLKEALE